jgi:RNA polymerase sigma-70 factor (ECF subfamily)
VNKKINNQDEILASDFIDVYTRLLATARAMGYSDSAAEDRVQDACIRLLEAQQRDVIGNKEHYFRRILRNLKIDGLRRQSRSATVPVDDLLIDPRPSPDRAAQARQELAVVAKALEALPPRCRYAFKLHRFGNLSYADIAQRMGISNSMVEKHIAEAIFRLATALDKR